jgi:GSCFA family
MCRLFFCYFVMMGDPYLIEVENEENTCINHNSQILLSGSCFAEHIGQRMIDLKMDVSLNPWGILYNPISIACNLLDAIEGRVYIKEDIFQHQELWKSDNHHGSFSHPDAEVMLNNMNESLRKAQKKLMDENLIILITLGNAWVYEKDGNIVANCHKLPASTFTKRLLSVEEIVRDFNRFVEQLLPSQKVIFTISPVRYKKDGLHNSQLSKATLMLAANELVETHKEVSYFSAYEIVIDELRDYRFFNEDMVHPNSLAVDIVWNRFAQSHCTDECQRIMLEWQKIRTKLNHRLMFPQTSEARNFLSDLRKSITDFGDRYEIEVQDELNRISI